MPREVRFHPDARAELRAAVSFYEGEAPGLCRDLPTEVRVVIDRLDERQDSGSPVEPDVRRALLARFPFTVVYLISRTSIELVAVMHQRQRPGYWRDRI